MDILAPYKDVLYISSANRSSGTPNQFSIDLAGKFKIPNNYDSIVLLIASIPKSFYLVTDLNNTFDLIENGTTYTVTIPVGNYGFTSLGNQLGASLTAASGNAITYTAVGNRQTGKYTFTKTGALATDIDFTDSTFANICGFDPELYSFTGATLESVNMVNLQVTTTLQIQCDIVGGQDTILSEITSTGPSNSQIIYSENTPAYVSKPLKDNRATNINFWITDSENNLIDLNGVNWQCVIALYRADDTNERNLVDKRIELVSKTIQEGL